MHMYICVYVYMYVFICKCVYLYNAPTTSSAIRTNYFLSPHTHSLYKRNINEQTRARAPLDKTL